MGVARWKKNPAIQLVTPETDWFAELVPSAFSTLLVLGRKNPRKNVNPLVILLGCGPAGELCRNCKHFYRKHYSRTYYKCELRGDTNGPGTDHRAKWPACVRFERQ